LDIGRLEKSYEPLANPSKLPVSPRMVAEDFPQKAHYEYEVRRKAHRDVD
jgi:hypothetical protein